MQTPKSIQFRKRYAMRLLRKGVPIADPRFKGHKKQITARVMSNIERPWNGREALTPNIGKE